MGKQLQQADTERQHREQRSDKFRYTNLMKAPASGLQRRLEGKGLQSTIDMVFLFHYQPMAKF